MKTIHIISTLLVTVSLFTVHSVDAARVIKLSSGIKSQVYTLEWCSPRARVVNIPNQPTTTDPAGCMEGTLTDVGGVATIKYNGENFPVGGVTATPIFPLPGTTRTPDVLAAAGSTLISLFSNSTTGALSLEGEGVVTVRAVLTDYADNTSFIWVRYKIDKTGPQIVINSISENSDYTHQGMVATSLNIFKNDSANNSSSPTQFANPAISSYANQHSATTQTLTHSRSNLQTIYFQNTNTGLGANTPFNLVLNTSDTFNGYLLPNAAGSSYAGPLISDLSDMELRDSAGTAPLGLVPLSGNLTTANLINNIENGQSKYRLRLYDRSVDASGIQKSGNYSEAAFYAVRDNTAPNLGGNGGESTLRAAYERLLQFPDQGSVYDMSAYANNYFPETNGVSRMFGADDKLSLTYRLNDTGITGNGINAVGTTAGNFDHYNAGINTSGTVLKIENADNPSVQDEFVRYSDRYQNTGSKERNFSKVDNDLVSNSTYRKYGTSYETASINKLCDYVGNCLTPTLDFRVTANILNPDASNLTVDTQTNADGKILANGVDSYSLLYKLRDLYGNKVVPVVSLENNGTQFKTVTSKLVLNNGLYINQLTSNPTGSRLAIARDLETDNVPAVNVGDINTLGEISATEGGISPNGNYSYSLASGVPSSGAYPYLTGATKLDIQSLVNEAVVTAPSTATYPDSGTRMGSFTPNTLLGGTSNPIVSVYGGDITNLIGERGGANDIYLDETNYGRITRSPANGTISFSNMLSRQVNFEFASPYVYGLIGRQVLVDGKYSDHFKKLYLPRSTSIPYNIYEKDIVTYFTNGKDEQPGILNFTLRNQDGNQEGETNSGIYFRPSPQISATTLSAAGQMFIRDSTLRDTSLTNTSGGNFTALTGSGKGVSLQMSSIPTFGAYDNTKLRVGLVSALAYVINSNTVQLPSIGRGMVRPGTTTAINQYAMARNYFDDNYTIGDATDIVNPMNAAALTDIAITGLTNQYNGITTDTGATQANTVVEAEISRSTFVTTVKKNVATLTAGFGASRPNNWCTIPTINQDILSGTDPSITACTIESNGEKITFIEGNSLMNCGPSGICYVDSRRSLVVRNGSLGIQSNITTRDSTGNQTDGQLVLVSMATDGLSDISLGTTIDRTDPNTKGWMFIGTEVTNVDAFLIAQGPITSFDQITTNNTSKVYGKTNTLETELVNQLHINGSILALNTIGGGRDNVGGNYVCPYIVTNCDQNSAQYFDLIFMRRFKAIGLSYFTNTSADNNTLVPFYPDRTLPYSPGTGELLGGALRSGGLTGTQGTPNDPRPSIPAQSLRHITDAAYQSFPMLIERDTRWNNSPSRLFLSGN